MCLSRIGGVRRKHLKYLVWKDTMILASLGSSVCGETYVTESLYGESEGVVCCHPSLVIYERGATAQADASNPCVHDVIIIARCRTHTKDLTLINALDLNRHNTLTPKSLFKRNLFRYKDMAIMWAPMSS